MPEAEVSAGTKGDRGDGAPGRQLSLVVSMLPNVVTAIFVPRVREQARLSSGQPVIQRRRRRLVFLWRAPGEASPGSADEAGLGHPHQVTSCLKAAHTKSSRKDVSSSPGVYVNLPVT